MSTARINVCALIEMETTVRQTGASHVVSLINAQMMPATPDSIESKNHLKLAMNDIGEPTQGLVAPSERHINALIDFVASWDRAGDLVIHCWAGISRSTAGAFVTLCALNADIDEIELAWLIRNLSPTATPNSLLISSADRVLQRNGRMIEAVEAIGRGDIASKGVAFSTPAIVNVSAA